MEDPCITCVLRGKRDSFIHRNQDRSFTSPNNPPASSVYTSPDQPLRDIQELLHTIIESSTDCILVWDRHYNYLYANQAAIDHVKTTPDKVIGKNIRDGLGHVPEFMQQWISRIDKVFETGHSMHYNDTTAIDGKLIHSDSVVSPVHHPDGSIYAISVVYRDVTEKKMLEQELIQNEQKYRNLYNHAQVPLYRTRFYDGKMLECNHAMAAMLGYKTKEECIEKCYSPAHYTDPNRRSELLEKLRTENEVKGFQIQFIRLNGAKAWTEITAKLYPEKGYIEGVQYDITASKLLSKTEQTVLKAMMQNPCNKEIAKQLKRSVRTIEAHRQHIMQKLGVDNIVELTHIAQSLDYATENP